MGNAEPDMPESFDTLASSKLLRKSGIPAQQAEAVVGVVKSAMGTLVTREYLDLRLEALESRIGTRFAEVESRFNAVNARFDKVDARFEKVDARFEKLEARMETRFGEMETRFDQMETRFDRLESQIGAQQARWALTIVLSQVATSGLLFTLLNYSN